VNIISGKGENTAESISEYIGVDVAKAQKKLDMHFKDESAFQGVNNALNFDYIIESDDSVNVDGINYPEWAALVIRISLSLLSDNLCFFSPTISTFSGLFCFLKRFMIDVFLSGLNLVSQLGQKMSSSSTDLWHLGHSIKTTPFCNIRAFAHFFKTSIP
jgi:hypothetical protein